MDIFTLYQKEKPDNINKFNNKLSSKLHIYSTYEKNDNNLEWLSIMENTIRYLDNILRNPNKFIVNEEDVIKIELAKRVTVESIKHLSRNTNLIQDIDKKTGDVKPSKILNINKEESFDTYENRFIYSLIQNMKLYINKKKSSMNLNSYVKSNKKLEYVGSSLIGKEKVNMNLVFDSTLDDSDKKNNEEIIKRIEDLEMHIRELCNYDVYKNIDKLHISLVRSPIKKTNVIIKNVNFQYAMKLWTFLEADTSFNNSSSKEKKDYYDEGKFRNYINDTFLLNYLVCKAIDGDVTEENKTGISKMAINDMVEKVTSLNKDISLEELQQLVKDEFQVVKYRNVVSNKYIQKLYKESMDKYIERVSKLKI